MAENVGFFEKRFADSVAVKKAALASESFMRGVKAFADEIVLAIRSGHCVFLAGNGGSAADAQHIAAELVSKFYLERRGLPAEALTTNSSILTAIANDYSFESVFSRQLEARAVAGDLFVGITTSGNSVNILKAAEKARQIGMRVVGMTGEGGGALTKLCDLNIGVPSNDTPRIQEVHILVGHAVCEYAEAELC